MHAGSVASRWDQARDYHVQHVPHDRQWPLIGLLLDWQQVWATRMITRAGHVPLDSCGDVNCVLSAAGCVLCGGACWLAAVALVHHGVLIVRLVIRYGHAAKDRTCSVPCGLERTVRAVFQ